MELSNLKRKFLNKDCVILTCGPSLEEYSKKQIHNFIKDKIVICIKESIIEYRDHADFFFWNDTRSRSYDINSKTIKIYQSSQNNKNYHNYPADIVLPEDLPFNSQNQLLKTKNFEKYDLDNCIKRPWGPGILYESVFYFCKYIGIKNIYTIGWDLVDKDNFKNIEHYFENNYDNNYKDSGRWQISNNIQNTNFKYEMLMVNNNIVDMYDYFKREGVNIYVVGHKSFVNKYIPRIFIK